MPTWPRRALPYAVGGSLYLALSVVLWWHVWSTHPTATATCGCGDPALFMWFLEWPAYAIAHGHDPFFSTYLFHPDGINLLSNTSVLAIGIPLAPVTWLFGPVATLNVASTLAPALSAMAAFWVLRRWARWAPAAFVGGLLYGFSPYVLSSLVTAHLMTASLAPLPLMLACLDELFVRQRRRPVPVGIALAVLATVEFFVSTELLVIAGMAAAIGLVLLAAYRAVVDRADLVLRVRRALPGVVAAVALSVVLLAYPAWYALAGPAHLSGEIWPNIPIVGGLEPRTFTGFSPGRSFFLELGGYYGGTLPSAGYVSWALIGVLAAGLVIWRKDRRLWFFGALAVLTGVLTLGVRKGIWVPWRLFGGLPVLENVIEQRFMAVTTLALAAMLAIVVDRARRLGAAHRHHRATVGLLAAAVAVVVGLGQLVWTMAPELPFTVQPVQLPTWFRVEAPKLAPGEVLLAYPAPFSGIQASMAWQAVDRMSFAQAGGGGPQGVADRAGAEKAGFRVLAALGFGLVTPAPAGTPAEMAAVRRALRGWQVTMVVIPRQPGRSSLLRGRSPAYAAAFMTAALGTRPVLRSGAWVWPQVDLSHPALRVPAGGLLGCSQRAPAAVAGCVAAVAR
ncbi:MAG TPA: hypothetical protein VHB02_07815 [Acidimicrobiales bacterium]|nr:hypothetical protein [Acidimicrobiales bacterium]